jgi:hypothetical protein
MMGDAWFEAYAGQTTEELLALENTHRVDSLVLAFEQALQEKAASRPISKEERYVLAVEALEREVNNGGYSQFFLNSSHPSYEFIDVIEAALLAIGCPRTAEITRRAIASLEIDGPITGEKAATVVGAEDEGVRDALGNCDDDYYGNDESIADLLFQWIRENRNLVRVGAA